MQQFDLRLSFMVPTVSFFQAASNVTKRPYCPSKLWPLISVTINISRSPFFYVFNHVSPPQEVLNVYTCSAMYGVTHQCWTLLLELLAQIHKPIILSKCRELLWTSHVAECEHMWSLRNLDNCWATLSENYRSFHCTLFLWLRIASPLSLLWNSFYIAFVLFPK